MRAPQDEDEQRASHSSPCQTAHLVPAARFCAPGLQLCFAPPEWGGGERRHSRLLTSPQVASGYFKGVFFFACVVLTPPLASSGFVVLNQDRAKSRRCAPGTSFRPPLYAAFGVRAATPMAATFTSRWPTAAKAGSSSISVMAASATWVWAALGRFRSR